MTESSPDLGVLAQASLAELRSSLKWLVAAAGAVVAALVAGIQLTSIPADDLGSWRPWVAGVAVVAALSLVVSFLRSAVLVMTQPRPTAGELTKREQRANVEKFLALGKDIDDPVIQALYTQKSYYFSQYDSIADLYENDYVQARNALKTLNEGKEATWRERTMEPTDAEKQRLQSAIAEVQRLIPVLESVAHLELTKSEYRRLVNRFPLWGLIFVVAIGVFAAATRPVSQPGAAVTTPTNARIIVVNRSEAALPKECDATELQGVAVGGTWDKPTIVTVPTPECPSTLIHEGEGILAIPIVPALTSSPRPTP